MPHRRRLTRTRDQMASRCYAPISGLLASTFAVWWAVASSKVERGDATGRRSADPGSAAAAD
jgi:hypothetical protein